MKYLLIIILLLISGTAFSQTTYYIRADSTRLEKIGGNNELILKNGTRTRTGGYLKNTFDGRTGFFYAVDSAYISGGNLVLVRGGGTQNVTVVIPGGSTPGLQDVITQDPDMVDDATIGIPSAKLFKIQKNTTSGNSQVPAFVAEYNLSGASNPPIADVGRFDFIIPSGGGSLTGTSVSGVVTRLTTSAATNLSVYSGLHVDPVISVEGSTIGFHEGLSIDGWGNHSTINYLYGVFLGQVSNGTGGSVNNHYGIYIDDVSLGVTENFALYTVSGGIRLGALPTGASTDSIMTWEASTGIVRKRNVASITGVNIYNSDGTLTGDREVSGGGNFLQFTGVTNFVAQTTGGVDLNATGGGGQFSQVLVKIDTIILKPYEGELKIDSLDHSITATDKMMVWDSVGQRVATRLIPSAGGGGSPAGNFGNLQINRNGAFATPGSDSLDFDGGLVVKGSVTSSTLTDGRVLIGGASGLIRDYAALTYDGMNLLNTTTGGASTGITITSTNASSYSSMNFVTTLGGNGFQIGKYGPTGSVANGVFFYNPDNSPTVFTQNNNRILDITGAGNLLLGGTTDPASAYYTIGLHNGGAPTGSITNGVIIYSEDVAASAELKVRDEAGNITVLSPHNFTGIPMGKSEDMAWSYYSERDGKYITVDMLKAIRTIEKLTVRVAELEKRLGVEPTKPTKLVYKGKVKVKQPVPINKNK